MLSIPQTLFAHTDYEPLLKEKSRYGKEVEISDYHLDDQMLAEVAKAAEMAGENKTLRVVQSMIAARAGDASGPVTGLVAFPDMLKAFLRDNLIDGWLYRRHGDDHLHPWLVTNVRYESPKQNDDKPRVVVSLVANGNMNSLRHSRGSGLGLTQTAHTFFGADVVRRKVPAILSDAGFLVETEDLRADYDAAVEAYTEILTEGFAEQYRYTGSPLAGEDYGTPNARENRKVIHDLMAKEVVAPSPFSDSVLFTGDDDDDGAPRGKGASERGSGAVPIHTVLRVFDLHTHEFMWVNTLDLVRYEYDKALRDKIILPEDQRNLLDILTTDLSDFTGDIIEGKSAGNVVLAKGRPGVGKTLTAEVYSELIERPLYSIHSGNLGTRADEVRKNLETTFERAQRWNAVLLLDEADVFVLERGGNIEQNAIVAEFLRTLEYFTGLMFMTTNRADSIDDAILSRAAAIIDYKVPDIDGIRAVWKVQADNHGIEIPEVLLEDVVHGFAEIAPRDVKMLLRLALRMSKGNGHDLDIATIAKCAMFRGLHYSPGSRKADS